MAQTKILIDYDLNTWEIRRITHPGDDSEIFQHFLTPGWGRVEADHSKFPVTTEGKPAYTLTDCGDVVQRSTGKRPPNA